MHTPFDAAIPPVESYPADILENTQNGMCVKDIHCIVLCDVAQGWKQPNVYQWGTGSINGGTFLPRNTVYLLKRKREQSLYSSLLCRNTSKMY